MIEDELRAAFARQETNIPELGALRAAIDRAVFRRRRRRRAWTASTAAVAVCGVVAGVAGPTALDRAVGGSEPVAEALAGISKPAVVMPRPSLPDGPLNGLLTVVDETRNVTNVMLAHVPADHGKMFVLSLPPDVLAPERLLDRDAAGVVTSVIGVKVHPAVTVNVAAVPEWVDGIGGVPACLAGRGGCRVFDGATTAEVLRSPEAQRDSQRLAVAMLRKSGTLDLAYWRIPPYVNFLRQFGNLGLLENWVQAFDPSKVVGLVPDLNAVAQVSSAIKQDTLESLAVAHPDWVTEIQR